MRFDTLDKKPNLFGIIYASIVMLVFLIIFIIGRQDEAICLLIMTYLLVVLYILGISFIRQLQYNPYSYNTIYYAGFFLFIFFILITIIRIYLLVANKVEGYSYMNVISCILSSAKNYM